MARRTLQTIIKKGYGGDADITQDVNYELPFYLIKEDQGKGRQVLDKIKSGEIKRTETGTLLFYSNSFPGYLNTYKYQDPVLLLTKGQSDKLIEEFKLNEMISAYDDDYEDVYFDRFNQNRHPYNCGCRHW
jgi:hypothetical protein